MFCIALKPLLTAHSECLRELEEIADTFSIFMKEQLEKMWAAKLGLSHFNKELFSELELLMVQTPVDYTIFFRELSSLPADISSLKKSFYNHLNSDDIIKRWEKWLTRWHDHINADPLCSRAELSTKMKLINPKYILREWFVVPAYQQAAKADYTLIRELQEIMTMPYAEQSKEVEEKYYKLKPSEFLKLGGLSYYSCSS